MQRIWRWWCRVPGTARRQRRSLGRPPVGTGRLGRHPKCPSPAVAAALVRPHTSIHFHFNNHSAIRQGRQEAAGNPAQRMHSGRAHIQNHSSRLRRAAVANRWRRWRAGWCWWRGRSRGQQRRRRACVAGRDRRAGSRAGEDVDYLGVQRALDLGRRRVPEVLGLPWILCGRRDGPARPQLMIVHHSCSHSGATTHVHHSRSHPAQWTLAASWGGPTPPSAAAAHQTGRSTPGNRSCRRRTLCPTRCS